MCIRDRPHTEGDLLAGGALDILEVDKDALRGLRPEEDLIFGIFGYALIGLEHQVELADIGEDVYKRQFILSTIRRV